MTIHQGQSREIKGDQGRSREINGDRTCGRTSGRLSKMTIHQGQSREIKGDQGRSREINGDRTCGRTSGRLSKMTSSTPIGTVSCSSSREISMRSCQRERGRHPWQSGESPALNRGGNQWQSVAISGNPWPSVALRGITCSSTSPGEISTRRVVRPRGSDCAPRERMPLATSPDEGGNQMSLEAIRGHQSRGSGCPWPRHRVFWA